MTTPRVSPRVWMPLQLALEIIPPERSIPQMGSLLCPLHTSVQLVDFMATCKCVIALLLQI